MTKAGVVGPYGQVCRKETRKSAHEERARGDNISKNCCAKPWQLQTQRVRRTVEARRGPWFADKRQIDNQVRYWMKGSMLKDERKKK